MITSTQTLKFRKHWASMIRRHVWIAYDAFGKPVGEGFTRVEAARNANK